MKLIRRSPPSTDNREAADLIRRATLKCAGCAADWRVYERTGWRHRGGIECTARDERSELREIAQEKRT